MVALLNPRCGWSAVEWAGPEVDQWIHVSALACMERLSGLFIQHDLKISTQPSLLERLRTQ
jgi:hypothetical protein